MIKIETLKCALELTFGKNNVLINKVENYDEITLKISNEKTAKIAWVDGKLYQLPSWSILV